MNSEKLFLEQLPLIERVIASICRRSCCYGAEAEDFASEVKLKLLENDYQVLRRFRGKSRLATYLTTVVANCFRDFRIKKWGKWRPSAAARKLGPLAVQLETLLSRDGHTLDEACEILRLNHRVERSRAELHELAAQLPPRTPRRFTDDAELERLPAQGSSEDQLLDREREAAARDSETALNRALRELSAEDRLILKLRFASGFTVAQIARCQAFRQRQLYSRIERCMKELRRSMESAGIGSEQIRSLLGGDGAAEIRLDFQEGEETENEEAGNEERRESAGGEEEE